MKSALRFFYNTDNMLFADFVTKGTHASDGLLVGTELLVIPKTGLIENDVVVDMVPVNVSCDDVFVLMVGEPVDKFTANAVGLFGCDLARLDER